jgi:hypothetical protein
MTTNKANMGGKDDAMSTVFGITDEDLSGAEILFAGYVYESYEGDAFVLFRRDGKFYEVHGGHCSCYGLEGQWEPEEITAAALLDRLEKGYGYGVISNHKYQIRDVIRSHDQ